MFGNFGFRQVEELRFGIHQNPVFPVDTGRRIPSPVQKIGKHFARGETGLGDSVLLHGFCQKEAGGTVKQIPGVHQDFASGAGEKSILNALLLHAGKYLAGVIRKKPADGAGAEKTSGNDEEGQQEGQYIFNQLHVLSPPSGSAGGVSGKARNTVVP